MGVEAAIAAVAVGVSAYGAYSQHQASTEANDMTQGAIEDQKKKQKEQDDALGRSAQENEARRNQDAQWMQLKTMQNQAPGSGTTAPYSLTSQSAAAGAAAGSKAGKV